MQETGKMASDVRARVVWIRDVTQCSMQRISDGRYQLKSDRDIVLERQLGGQPIATLQAGIYLVRDTGSDVVFEPVKRTLSP